LGAAALIEQGRLKIGPQVENLPHIARLLSEVGGGEKRILGGVWKKSKK
jgi:hypothetical protein